MRKKPLKTVQTKDKHSVISPSCMIFACQNEGVPSVDCSNIFDCSFNCLPLLIKIAIRKSPKSPVAAHVNVTVK